MTAMKESPFLERFVKKNVEVILFEDAIDEYMVSSL
jgi:HSP90 family molecular chaperone